MYESPQPRSSFFTEIPFGAETIESSEKIIDQREITTLLLFQLGLFINTFNNNGKKREWRQQGKMLKHLKCFIYHLSLR